MGGEKFPPLRLLAVEGVGEGGEVFHTHDISLTSAG
jgi:hypothetical protein